ncbi:MAG TPA: hypothetical protein VG734_25545 [Lacunisphaera sp.]|jgi:hypothetical protein|nr:hypothetical protein [Lacunisphaera sp.]
MQVILDQMQAARAELAAELEKIEAAIARHAVVLGDLEKLDLAIADLSGTAKPKRVRKTGGAKPGPKKGRRRGGNPAALAATTSNGSHPGPIESQERP